jgi:hypothetical protein
MYITCQQKFTLFTTFKKWLAKFSCFYSVLFEPICTIWTGRTGLFFMLSPCFIAVFAVWAGWFGTKRPQVQILLPRMLENKGKRQKNSPQFLTTLSGGYNFGKAAHTEIAAP